MNMDGFTKGLLFGLAVYVVLVGLCFWLVIRFQ
jgi:hypothetical protein